MGDGRRSGVPAICEEGLPPRPPAPPRGPAPPPPRSWLASLYSSSLPGGGLAELPTELTLAPSPRPPPEVTPTTAPPAIHTHRR